MKELISVIIPTYKRNDTLERAIKSVINQTYDNLEIIIVDDNANFPEIRNNNKEIIKKFKDYNIKFIENEKNLGGGLSRNVGIKCSNAKYVAFLDDDDEYLPNKIEEQYNLLKSIKDPNVAMIYCYAKMINIDGSSYYLKKDFEGNQLLENTKSCIAATSWWLCSKEKLLDVGGFENISSRQDASLLMKLFVKGYTAYRVPQILLNYYWHDSQNGISKIDKKTIIAEKQYYELFKTISLNIDKNEKKAIEYIFNYRIANLLVRNGEKKEAFHFFKNMFKICPLKLQNIRVLLCIIFNKIYIIISKEKNKRKVGV